MSTLTGAIQHILVNKQRYLTLHKGEVAGKDNLVFSYPVENLDEKSGNILKADDENHLAEKLQEYFAGYDPEDIQGEYVLVTKMGNTAPTKKVFKFCFPDSFRNEKRMARMGVNSHQQQPQVVDNSHEYIAELLRVQKEAEQSKRDLELKIVEFQKEVAINSLKQEISEIKKAQEFNFMTIIDKVLINHGDKILPVIAGIFGSRVPGLFGTENQNNVQSISGIENNQNTQGMSDETSQRIVNALQNISEKIGEEKTVLALEKIQKIVEDKPHMVDLILNMNI